MAAWPTWVQQQDDLVRACLSLFGVMSAYVNKRHTPLLKNDCAPMHHEPEAKKGRDSHKIARLHHTKHTEVDKHQASLSRPDSNIVSCPLGDSQPLIPAHISHPYSPPSAHFPARQNYIYSNPPFAKPQPSTIHHGSLQSTPHHPSAIHRSSTPRRVGPPHLQPSSQTTSRPCQSRASLNHHHINP